jgi:hypothetical protein
VIGSYGKPYGVNYAPSTPLREPIRSYFANDSVGAIGIGIDMPAIRRAVETPLHPPPTKGGRGLGGLVLDRDRNVAIKLSTLAGSVSESRKPVAWGALAAVERRR